MKNNVLQRPLWAIAVVLTAFVLGGCPSPTGSDGGDPGGSGPGAGGPTGPVGPTGPISLNPSAPQGIQISETLTVTAGVEGGQIVTWGAGPEGVVTLNANANSVEITGAALGRTTVSAILPDDQSASLEVTVYEPGITLVTPATTVVHTESADLSGFAQITPAEFTAQTFTYSSGDPSIVSVNANGVVTGEAPGSATVTITSAIDPTDSVTVDVTVDPFPVNVVVTEGTTTIGSLSMVTGQGAIDLDASVEPASFPQGVTWSVGNPAVANIDPTTGSVTPAGAGTTQIVATSNYNPARQAVIPLEVGIPGSLTLEIVDGIGGPFLDGAQVTLSGGPSNLNAPTDASGAVTFATVLPGRYTIDVTKAGYATSRVQSFAMPLSDQTIELPIYRAATDFRSTDPPRITVTGIVPGATYDAPASVTVTATGDNPIAGNSDRFGLAVGVGGPADGRNALDDSDRDSLTFTFDSSTVPDGPVTVTFVAYDNNNNRTQYSFEVNTADGSGFAPSLPVSNSHVNFVEAVTWGVQQPLFAAGANSTVQVRMSVDRPTSSVTGLRVYRADAVSGPFALIGQTTQPIEADADGDPNTPATEEVFLFNDTSSILTPGRDYFYRFSYFNGAGEGSNAGSTHGVTILPAYRLNLTAPADQVANVANPVTFSWDVTVDGTMPTNAERQDGVYLVDATVAQLLYTKIVTNGLSDTLSASLASGRVYEWNVFSRWTLQGTTDESRSVAYPSNLGVVPYLPGVGSFANNGGFQFTAQHTVQ